MTPDQLREEIIRPILKDMNLWSQEAEDIMIGTAIHESDGLKRIRQYDGGPALSYFQMEPATLFDLYENFLKYRPEWMEKLNGYQAPAFSLTENLTMNVAFAVAAARIQYFRVPESIPKTNEGQAAYWKKYWNTNKGKGTVEKYLSDLKRFGS